MPRVRSHSRSGVPSAVSEQRRVHLLVDDGGGGHGEAGERAHLAGGGGEGVAGVCAGLTVEDLHHRDTCGLGAVDERLHVAEESGQLGVGEVRPVAEGFLYVDDE